MFYTSFFWCMTAICASLPVISSYCVVLAAGTITVNTFFITVLTYFQKVPYRDLNIFCVAAAVPILFLVISQFLYFCWYAKLPAENIVSYASYMINVCAGIGFAIADTFVRTLLKNIYFTYM